MFIDHIYLSVNQSCVTVWPFISFWRQFWFAWELESDGIDYRVMSESDTCHVVAARARLIGICTEALLQPLFQFYMFLATASYSKVMVRERAFVTTLFVVFLAIGIPKSAEN